MVCPFKYFSLSPKIDKSQYQSPITYYPKGVSYA